jgi:hypothetical protein
MGACKYIGVDQQRVTNEALEPNDLYQGLVGERRREEMLSFLKKYEPPPEGVVVFMSGIEPENPNSPASIEFQKKCCSEITRILAFGGAVIIGPATFGFKLKDAGLKLRIAGTYHAIYIP